MTPGRKPSIKASAPLISLSAASRPSSVLRSSATERATSEMPAILDLIEGSWEGPAARIKARAIADAFVRHWDTHHAVLLARNISSDEGDRRFQAIRNRAMAPVVAAFANKIAAGQARGEVRTDIRAEQAAVFLITAAEGALATVKMTRDPALFADCFAGLTLYLDSLRADRP